MAPLIVSIGALLVLCALIAVAAPFIAADMRRAVQRGTGAPTDATALTLLILGPALWVAAAGGCVWLGMVWK